MGNILGRWFSRGVLLGVFGRWGGGSVTFERGAGLNFMVKFLGGVRGLRGVIIGALGILKVMKARARGASVSNNSTGRAI